MTTSEKQTAGIAISVLLAGDWIVIAMRLFACRGFVNLSNDGCLQSIFLKDGIRNDTK
jgi:hypothetical protein